MGFQTQVNLTQAPAVAGDFASANPRASVLAGPEGLVAGPGGVTVGKFAWMDDNLDTVQSFGTGTRAPDGFVHREQQALIQTYLGEASMNVPEGFPVTLHSEGDFYAVNSGPATSALNDTVYASYADGSITVGAAASGASATGAMGSTNTAALGATFTATGTGTSFAVTSVTGKIHVGDVISGTGVTVGTTIVAQVSGTTGGAGTYTTSAATTSSGATITAFGATVVVSATTGLISIGDTVSGGAGFPVGATVATQVSGTTGGAGTYTLSAAGSAYTASASGVTTFGSVLNITAVASGSLDVGEPVSGTGVPSGAVIASQTSGTVGAIGVYVLDRRATAYAASTTITGVGGVATGYKAKSIAAVGELVKISTWG